MIIRPTPWRNVEAGMTVLAPDGGLVVAPGPWPSDAAASVALVSEHEAAANLRAAGFTWELLETIEETS
jgi:hypothetical protein